MSTPHSAGARRTSGSTHQANVGLLRYKSPQFPTVQCRQIPDRHDHEARPNQRPPASREQASSPPTGKDQAGLPLDRCRESTTARTRSDGGPTSASFVALVYDASSRMSCRRAGRAGQRVKGCWLFARAAQQQHAEVGVHVYATHRPQSHRNLCRQRRLFSDFVVASASLVRHRCRHRNTRAMRTADIYSRELATWRAVRASLPVALALVVLIGVRSGTIFKRVAHLGEQSVQSVPG